METDKYIVFSATQSKSGIDQIFRILTTVFIEAFSLGRVPVIGNFAVRSSHNRYIRRSDFNFSDYLDLTKGVLRKRSKIDCIIKKEQEWVEEKNLDLKSYSESKVCQVKDEVISDEMHLHNDVIIRRDPTPKYVENYLKQKQPDLFLDFPYSEKVTRYTDIALEKLGTTREKAMAAQHYFWDKVTTMRACFDKITRARGSSISLIKTYACLHVIARKSNQENKQLLLQFSTSKKQIQEVLSYAINQRSRLYVMSDIQHPNHFDFLKEKYKVFRYHDFPELNRLVSGEDGNDIDNIMLYLVEKNIMKHATIKILPPNRNSMVYHSNEIYNLSALKDPPVRNQPAEKPSSK